MCDFSAFFVMVRLSFTPFRVNPSRLYCVLCAMKRSRETGQQAVAVLRVRPEATTSFLLFDLF